MSMPTTEQDPLYAKIKRIVHGEADDIALSDHMLRKPQKIYTLLLDARLEELRYCRKYMISTSPFIERIIDPRIAELESQKNQLTKGAQE